MSTINRIDHVFAELAKEGRKALIPFITTGDPSLEQTQGLMHALVKGGADIIELGVPFSDPMADGPVIQRASDRAVRNGVGLKDVLATVQAFRLHNQDTPIVLMGYANPIEAMGIETFVEHAKQAGVDGVLVVDYPPEEAESFSAALTKHGLHPIFLLAPTTTDERVKALARQAKGYVYYVSLNGVTGAAHLDAPAVQKRIHELRKHISIPMGVGFGIRDAQTAVTIAHSADAVVIGSRLVHLIESTPIDQVENALSAWLGDVRHALDQEFHA